MKNISPILLLFLIYSCTTKHIQSSYYISTLENIKDFPATEKETKNIDSINQSLKEFSEKCERDNLNCIIDGYKVWAEFKGGISKFRETLFKNFKLPQNAKEGENRIRVTIGKNNRIEKIEILKYTDIATRKAIEDVFKLKELNNWSSAKIYSIPIKTQFEISIFIVDK